MASALFFCLMLATSISISCQQRFSEPFYNASTDLAMDFLKAFSRDASLAGKNLVYSPTNIQAVLSVLQQGAGGKTSGLLNRLLHMTPEISREGFQLLIKSVRAENSVLLRAGTNMYLKPGFNLSENFQKTVRENFNNEVSHLNFPNGAAEINNWVSNITEGYITEIIQEDVLTPETVMVLASAVFFDGEWLESLSLSTELNVDYHVAPDKTIKAAYMHGARRLVSGGNGLFTWVQLPYKGNAYSMLFISPKEKFGLEKVIANLNGVMLREILDSKTKRTVLLSIPKFTLKKNVPVKQVLINMGFGDLFTRSANLSGIAPGVTVSDIIHEAYLEVDEKGSKAAAASAVVIQTLSLQFHSDEITFNADHPFLAIIVDQARGMPLFIGKIVNPIES